MIMYRMIWGFFCAFEFGNFCYNGLLSGTSNKDHFKAATIHPRRSNSEYIQSKAKQGNTCFPLPPCNLAAFASYVIWKKWNEWPKNFQVLPECFQWRPPCSLADGKLDWWRDLTSACSWTLGRILGQLGNWVIITCGCPVWLCQPDVFQMMSNRCWGTVPPLKDLISWTKKMSELNPWFHSSASQLLWCSFFQEAPWAICSMACRPCAGGHAVTCQPNIRNLGSVDHMKVLMELWPNCWQTAESNTPATTATPAAFEPWFFPPIEPYIVYVILPPASSVWEWSLNGLFLRLNIAALPSGAILDHCGPRATATFFCMMVAVGCVIFSQGPANELAYIVGFLDGIVAQRGGGTTWMQGAVFGGDYSNL